MTLTLLAVSLNERPLSQPIVAHFDNRGGTIGRADHNTMALPDPERHVSRLQAEIIANGRAFMIRNMGSANPITVAGRPVNCGESASLFHGDEIRIGGYLLQADLHKQEAALDVTRGRAMLSASQAPAPRVEAPSAPAPTPTQAAVAPALRQPPPRLGSAAPLGNDNPFADLLGSGPAVGPPPDPFADLLGNAVGVGSPAPAASPWPTQGLSPPAPAAPAPGPWPSPPPRTAPRMVAAADPFADLMPPPAGVLPSSAALAPVPGPASARLPDDFDPFAAPAAAAAPAPAVGTDPFADLMPAASPSSIDQVFGLGAAAPDALANFMASPVPTGAGPSSRPLCPPTDPLQALFGDLAPAPPESTRVQDDHVPALNAAFQPPRVRAASVADAPAAPPAVPLPPAPRPYASSAPAPLGEPFAEPFVEPLAVPPASPAAPQPAPQAAAPYRAPARGAPLAGDAQAMWAALCEGAQVNLPLPPGGAEEQMREIGRILRSAVDGTLRLMAVRASTKHELRADVTVIQSRGNNPLKFSPDANAGLGYLLQPAMRGFLQGPAAMDDAMQDLVGHSIGTVAGMRAAIGGMLDRFSPEQLEAKLSGKSVLDSVLPINRKAKLWDLYLQHHDAIREEAQEDFHTLFGKAFLAAYEQQIEQLRRGADRA